MNVNYLKIIGILLLIVVLIVAFIVAFCFTNIPEYFFGTQNSINPKGEFLKVIVQVSGGIILLLGAFYSLNIANSMKENNRLVEKGNIAERFKNAIAMLDNENSSTCLGGIYALNNIAKDNDEYREQVFKILVSFVNNKTQALPSWEEIEKPRRFSAQPSIMVKTIIKLLFSKQSFIYSGFRADFENAKLYGANFDDYNFSKCRFQNVEFQNSSFQEAWFIETEILNSDFTFSDFTNAYLTGSNIRDNSIFACCGFHWTNFTGCFIQGTDFSCSKIMDSNFNGARVNICCFDGVEIGTIDNGSFVGAVLSSTSIKGLVCSGNGLIARGARFDHGHVITGFNLNMKSIIGKKAITNTENKLEDFPKSKLEKFINLLDINSRNKFNHYTTVKSIKNNSNRRTTGWVFSDTGEFTKNDSKRILEQYDKAIKMSTIPQDK